MNNHLKGELWRSSPEKGVVTITLANKEDRLLVQMLDPQEKGQKQEPYEVAGNDYQTFQVHFQEDSRLMVRIFKKGASVPYGRCTLIRCQFQGDWCLVALNRAMAIDLSFS